MSLPNDVERCKGVFSHDEDGINYREGCEYCLRRTDKGTGEHIAHMMPPTLVVFECEFLIEDGDRSHMKK